MATKTGSSYNTGTTTTDSVEIPTASPLFWTMASPNKVLPNNCENDRQPEMAMYTFWAPSLQFLVVDRCRNHLADLLSSSSSSKIPNLAMEFRRYLSEFRRCNCFRLWRQYRYFRLSVAVVLTCWNYFPPIRGLTPQICRWSFNCAFHSFRDISIGTSDFRKFFRCRSSLESPRYTSYEFAMVECRTFVVGMLMYML